MSSPPITHSAGKRRRKGGEKKPNTTPKSITNEGKAASHKGKGPGSMRAPAKTKKGRKEGEWRPLRPSKRKWGGWKKKGRTISQQKKKEEEKSAGDPRAVSLSVGRRGNRHPPPSLFHCLYSPIGKGKKRKRESQIDSSNI